MLLLFSLLPGCGHTPDLDSVIHKATQGYRFRLLRWELKSLAGELAQHLGPPVTDNLTSLERQVEKQVREAFTEQGIFNPLGRFSTLKLGFPPVNVCLGKPPHVLVVSPRGRIDNIREVTLLPEMEEADMAAIETEIETLGYAAIIEELGGLSTFPSYITENADIRFIIDTAAHEWLHQYLTFTPLGFRYVLDELGIRRDYDVQTINETAAGIVSREIGEIIYRRYYAPPPAVKTTPGVPATGFDFNKAMRETRLAVDDYLARGEIEAAEKFMEAQRQYLAANGCYLRKLNQAYFAFHGAYADSPASVSPIGAELKKLRRESASLKEFLDTVAAMSSRRDLAESVR